MPRGRKSKESNTSVTHKPINIRLTTEEYDLFKYFAEKEGKSISGLAKDCLQPVIDKAKEEKYKDMEDENKRLKEQLEALKAKKVEEVDK